MAQAGLERTRTKSVGTIRASQHAPGQAGPRSSGSVEGARSLGGRSPPEDGATSSPPDTEKGQDQPTQSQADLPDNDTRAIPDKLDNPPEAPDISLYTESGWSAVSDIVTKVDKGRIDDYKEDIDSILVFAGLYSAVLTGLLAESINSLQQDSSQVVISLLVQLTQQTHTYSMSSGFLNSTAPQPDLQPPPFTPSLAAKRVNILWFASLMLSLISASFGILVKQWLREYLAGTYVSPQARLRVRHFREPGLEHWKVFTIAAFLPLLLQLSLALFFIGLCFFTLDIHSSVGYTTIPLVAAWAVLFVAASFAPILSPRCPYKTPSLKLVITMLRQLLFRCIALLRDFPDMGPKSSWLITPQWVYRLLAYTEKDAETSSMADINVLLTVDKTQLDDRLLQKICSALHEMRLAPEQMVTFVLKVLASRLEHTPATTLNVSVAQEPHNPKRGWFPSGESIRDRLSRVRGALKRSFRHDQKDPTLDAIVSRLRATEHNLPDNILPPMLDLTRLSPRTCTILMSSMARTLEFEIQKIPMPQAIEWSDWMKDCMALLCAKLPCLLPQDAIATLALCFSGTTWTRQDSTMKLLTAGIARDQVFTLGLHLQDRLRPMVLQLDSASFSNFTINLKDLLYCNCTVRCRSTGEALNQHHEEMGLLLQNHHLELHIEYLSRQLDVPWSDWHRNIFNVTLYGWYAGLQGTWRNAYIALVDCMLMDPISSRYICSYLFDYRYYNSHAVDVCEAAFVGSQYQPKILTNVKDSLVAFLDETERLRLDMTAELTDTLVQFLQGQIPWIRAQMQTEEPFYMRNYYIPLWQAMGRGISRVLAQQAKDPLICDQSVSK